MREGSRSRTAVMIGWVALLAVLGLAAQVPIEAQERAAAISVLMRESVGRPVSGVEVLVSGADWHAGTTDATGQVRFRVVPGLRDVAPSHGEFAILPTDQSVLLRNGESGDGLLAMIRDVIRDTPFAGEGHRKITARLRRKREVRVGRKRALRLMRQAGLLAPQRARGRRKPRPHDGTIIPAAPNRLWGTDATMAYTRDDGWVWAFVAIDHFTAEAWATVAKRGDRFAATEPIYDAVRQRFGEVTSDVARGIVLRHDWGPQYTSGHFQGALRWLGIEASPAFAGEPPCNGCAERFIRTLKEQYLWARAYAGLGDLRTAVRAFVERYSTQWLIERHGHTAPREVYAFATQVIAA